MTQVDTGVQSVNLQYLEMKEWNIVSKPFIYSAALHIHIIHNYNIVTTALSYLVRNVFWQSIHNAMNIHKLTPICIYTVCVVDLLGCGGSGFCSTLVTGETPEAVDQDKTISYTIEQDSLSLRAITPGHS